MGDYCKVGVLRGLVVLFCSFTVQNSLASNGTVDLHADDFSVLRYVGENYLKEVMGSQIEAKTDFGLGYTSHGDNPYPKVGFIGFHITKKDESTELLKLQLYKDASGWKVDRRLENTKIHQANNHHPYVSGHSRTDEAAKAKVVAAKSLEQWLNDTSVIERVRSTSMRCYLTKDLSRASCRGIYMKSADSNVTCHANNYLLTNTAGQWETLSEITDYQKVDYTTGELKSYKPFSMHCG